MILVDFLESEDVSVYIGLVIARITDCGVVYICHCRSQYSSRKLSFESALRIASVVDDGSDCRQHATDALHLLVAQGNASTHCVVAPLILRG